MKISKPLILLSSLLFLLALAAAGAGLFWTGGSGPFSFTTLHGRTVEISGRGLYYYDTFFKAPILRGTDAVTLFLALPLLVASLVFYRRGSLKAGLLLNAALAYLLYNAASLAFGVAYNSLHLLYIAYFSVSLFTFVLAFTAIDPGVLAASVSPGLPRRGIAAFMFVAGLSVQIWLLDILGALARHQVLAGLASYTTEVTNVIDLGIIGPTAFLTGFLVLRRAPLGYLLAPILLIVNAIVGAMVTAQTVAQTLAGIRLGIGEYVGKVGTFVLMSLIAIRLAVLLFRHIRVAPARPSEGG